MHFLNDSRLPTFVNLNNSEYKIEGHAVLKISFVIEKKQTKKTKGNFLGRKLKTNIVFENVLQSENTLMH